MPKCVSRKESMICLRMKMGDLPVFTNRVIARMVIFQSQQGFISGFLAPFSRGFLEPQIFYETFPLVHPFFALAFQSGYL